MMEMDFEDFLEEIKFQMTDYEELEKEVILEWENRVREWVDTHEDKRKRIVKHRDSIIIRIKDEDIMEEIAQKYYQAFTKKKEKQYWDKFTLL